MKAILIIIFNLCYIFTIIPIQAQSLSKQEEKEIKFELKRYKKNPLMFKIKMDQFAKTIDNQDEELEQLRAYQNNTKKRVDVMQDSIKIMHRAVDMLLEEAAQREAVIIDEPLLEEEPLTTINPKGLTFKVQVGRYMRYDIRAQFKDPKVFNYEVDNGQIVYNIGHFSSEEEALKFAQDIKKLGISDAFVVSYSDGKRIDNPVVTQ